MNPSSIAHEPLPASLSASRPASLQAAALPALSSYEHSLELDPSYRLFWTVDAATSRIQLAVSARTVGYVALGLSEVGAMVGTGEREGGRKERVFGAWMRPSMRVSGNILMVAIGEKEMHALVRNSGREVRFLANSPSRILVLHCWVTHS